MIYISHFKLLHLPLPYQHIISYNTEGMFCALFTCKLDTVICVFNQFKLLSYSIQWWCVEMMCWYDVMTWCVERMCWYDVLTWYVELLLVMLWYGVMSMLICGENYCGPVWHKKYVVYKKYVVLCHIIFVWSYIT